MKNNNKKHKVDSVLAKVHEINLLDMAVQCTKEYGTYTIENRAIPDYRDGLKPVQRRVLWAMIDLSLYSKGNTKKCARVIGNVIGKFHPHGDIGSYSALVNMVNSAEPTIIGQGNFGDYQDSAAAYRYTECKLSKYAEDYLLDKDYLDVVPYSMNYSGEYKEPVYLPAKIPNILVNGCEGIATGCSVGIPSFSRESVVNLIKKMLKNIKVTPKLLAQTLEFKFPYGGVCVSNDKELIEYFKTGEGSIYFQPEIKVEGRVISITNLAPRFSIEKTFDKILAMKGVKSLEDNREKRQIEFKLHLSENDKDLVKKIKAEMTSSLPCQMIMTIKHEDGEHADFMRTTPVEFLKKWLEYRIDLEKKVVSNKLETVKLSLQKLEWTLFAVLNRKVIIQSLDSDDPLKYLMKNLKIEEDQANFILDLKIRHLAKLEAKTIKIKIVEFKEEIKFLKGELKNINQRIIKQLSEKPKGSK